MTNEPQTLYFVHYDSDDNSNMDLLVRAANAADAILYWQMYFELPEFTEPDRIGAIPEAPAEGPIPWDQIFRNW